MTLWHFRGRADRPLQRFAVSCVSNVFEDCLTNLTFCFYKHPPLLNDLVVLKVVKSPPFSCSYQIEPAQKAGGSVVASKCGLSVLIRCKLKVHFISSGRCRRWQNTLFKSWFSLTSYDWAKWIIKERRSTGWGLYPVNQHCRRCRRSRCVWCLVCVLFPLGLETQLIDCLRLS